MTTIKQVLHLIFAPWTTAANNLARDKAMSQMCEYLTATIDNQTALCEAIGEIAKRLPPGPPINVPRMQRPH